MPPRVIDVESSDLFCARIHQGVDMVMTGYDIGRILHRQLYHRAVLDPFGREKKQIQHSTLQAGNPPSLASITCVVHCSFQS